MGEPGIGKSRLAAEVAKQAARYNANVFWSNCLESYDDCEFYPGSKSYGTALNALTRRMRVFTHATSF